MLISQQTKNMHKLKLLTTIVFIVVTFGHLICTIEIKINNYLQMNAQPSIKTSTRMGKMT